MIAAHWWSYFSSASSYQYGELSLATPDGNEEAMSALVEMVRSMVADRRNVYVVLNIPYGDAMDPRNMFERHQTSFEISSPPVLLSNLSRQVALTDCMRRLLQAAGAETIHPLAYLCNGERGLSDGHADG